MKTILLIAVTAIVGGLLPAPADASLQHVSFLQIPNLGNPSAEESYLEAHWSGGVDLTYLQKWDTDEQKFDKGPGNGTYSFSPSGNVPVMDITWDLGSTAYNLAYVLVKGGSAGSGNKFYNLYTVTADQVKDSLTPQEIILEARRRKAISHVSFFGVPASPPPPITGEIPEPSTIAVWGVLGLAGYFAAKKWQGPC